MTNFDEFHENIYRFGGSTTEPPILACQYHTHYLPYRPCRKSKQLEKLFFSSNILNCFQIVITLNAYFENHPKFKVGPLVKFPQILEKRSSQTKHPQPKIPGKITNSEDFFLSSCSGIASISFRKGNLQGIRLVGAPVGGAPGPQSILETLQKILLEKSRERIILALHKILQTL